MQPERTTHMRFRLCCATVCIPWLIVCLSHAQPARLDQGDGLQNDPTPIPGSGRVPGELLRNRSFEVDGNGDGKPDGWSLSRFGTGSTTTLVEGVAHKGARSVRISGTPKGRAGLSVGIAPDETDPELVYLLTAWVKVEGTSASDLRTSARITSVDKNGIVLKSDYRRCDPGPYDWRYHEWLLSLPAKTHRFNLVCFHHGTGSAWWDDVSLRGLLPTQALHPPQDGAVENPTPTFRWEGSGKGILEIRPEGAARGEAMRFAVSGGQFSLPESLPAGKAYVWRVIFEDEQGKSRWTGLRDAREGKFLWSRFFAGTRKQQIAAFRQRFAPATAQYARLQALARKNRMWDPFGLLGNALQEVDRTAAREPADIAGRMASVQETWDELEYTRPWWERIFLDDPYLFDGLDLDRAGLAELKRAVETKDFPAARKALWHYYRARKLPDYYGKYHARPPINPARNTDPRAEQLLTHKMPIHSYKEPTYDLGPDFDWHVFPIVDVEWPTKIHRHFHWRSLAGAYGRTNNEAYAEELVQQLFDWAKDNPMERWDRQRYRWAWSTLNTTIRIYSSWINSWLQVRESRAWRPDAQFVFLAALREHGRFLMTHAARQGNWVVAEARGLVELGVMFPEFKEAKAWREEGFRRLRRELAAQVLPDGVHIERTPGYHGMTMGCFMEPVRLGLLNGLEIDGGEDFVTKLEQMHEYYLYGAKPNHRMPQIGDTGPMNVDKMLRRGWNMFRRADMRWVVEDGKEGSPPVHRSYAFAAAGQYISRSAWNDPRALWSFIDWGAHVGHCHEDMGHISLYAYGSDLLVDTGRYSYAWPMRAPFYRTVGHNTVRIDGKTQKRRDPLTADWVSTEQFDVFRGTTDNSEPLLHERILAFVQPSADAPGYWLVVDRLTGEGNHRLDQRWHGFEKLEARLSGTSAILETRDGEDPRPSLVLAALPQPGLEPRVVEGAVSYAWYKKTPVDVVQFGLEGNMPATLVTVLFPTPPDAPPANVTVLPLPATLDAAAKADRGMTAVRVNIVDRGVRFSDTWVINHAPASTGQAGGLLVRGRMGMIRNGRKATRWLLAEGSRLAFEGRDLFMSEEEVRGAGARTTANGMLAFVCTGGTGVRFHAPAAEAVTVNGVLSPPPRGDAGMVRAGTVSPPVVAPVPRGKGPARFEIEPPPPPMRASSFLFALPENAPRPESGRMIEAENFTAQGGGEVEISENKTGASGKAFLHWDHAGHWLEWQVVLPTTGEYNLFIRACTAQDRALRKLTVNGTSPAGCEAMEFVGTGGFSNGRDDWRTFRVAGKDTTALVLELPAGKTTIRLENVDGNSLNLDWLILSPVP